MNTKISNSCYNSFTTLLLAALLIISTSTVVNAQNSEDAEWLIEALELKKGSVVAEMGAGDGRLSLEIARFVGPSGKVYTNELGADSVEFLQNVVKEAEISNITVIQGHPNRTNLPKACCDALFMRRVYHHFQDPAAMNKSIWQSLKPGGRLAVIDFAPRGGESADPEGRSTGSGHGVTAKMVVNELKKAGFTLVSSERRSGRNVYVVMQKKE